MLKRVLFLGLDQNQSFLDAAVLQAAFHIPGDVDEFPALFHIEPEFFAIGLHGSTSELMMFVRTLRDRSLRSAC